MTPTAATGSCQFLIRRGQIADIEAILAIAEASPEAARWPRTEYASACLPEASREAHIKKIFVAWAPKSEKILGFAAFSVVPVAGECELANMAVAAEFRRQHIGSRLLEAGLLWCRSWCPATLASNRISTDAVQAESAPVVWLEVRASNLGAAAFYQRSGFSNTGVRAAYYSHPVQDAVVMRRPLSDRPGGGKLPSHSG